MKTKLKTSKILILLFATITMAYTNLSYAAIYDHIGNDNRIPRSEPTFTPKDQILVPKYTALTNTGNGKYELVISFIKKGGHEDKLIDIRENYKVFLSNEEGAIKTLTVNEETIEYSGNCKDGEIGPEGSTCTVTIKAEEEDLSDDDSNTYNKYQINASYQVGEGENTDKMIEIKNKIGNPDIGIAFDKNKQQLIITNKSPKTLTIIEILNPSKHIIKIDKDIDGDKIHENNEHNKFTLEPNDDPRVFPLTQSEFPCDIKEGCKCSIIVVYKIKGDQKEKRIKLDGFRVDYDGSSWVKRISIAIGVGLLGGGGIAGIKYCTRRPVIPNAIKTPRKIGSTNAFGGLANNRKHDKITGGKTLEFAQENDIPTMNVNSKNQHNKIKELQDKIKKLTESQKTTTKNLKKTIDKLKNTLKQAEEEAIKQNKDYNLDLKKRNKKIKKRNKKIKKLKNIADAFKNKLINAIEKERKEQFKKIYPIFLALPFITGDSSKITSNTFLSTGNNIMPNNDNTISNNLISNNNMPNNTNNTNNQNNIFPPPQNDIGGSSDNRTFNIIENEENNNNDDFFTSTPIHNDTQEEEEEEEEEEDETDEINNIVSNIDNNKVNIIVPNTDIELTRYDIRQCRSAAILFNYDFKLNIITYIDNKKISGATRLYIIKKINGDSPIPNNQMKVNYYGSNGDTSGTLKTAQADYTPISITINNDNTDSLKKLRNHHGDIKLNSLNGKYKIILISNIIGENKTIIVNKTTYMKILQAFYDVRPLRFEKTNKPNDKDEDQNGGGATSVII